MVKDGYTTVELAERAGVSTAYLRHLLIAGRLNGAKVGRDWVIDRASAETWLREREAAQLEAARGSASNQG